MPGVRSRGLTCEPERVLRDRARLSPKHLGVEHVAWRTDNFDLDSVLVFCWYSSLISSRLASAKSSAPGSFTASAIAISVASSARFCSSSQGAANARCRIGSGSCSAAATAASAANGQNFGCRLNLNPRLSHQGCSSRIRWRRRVG